MKIQVFCFFLLSAVSGLNIALSNDDGWDAVGLQTLKTTLVDAGHTVTLVAPVSSNTATCTRLDLEAMAIEKKSENPDEFAVSTFTGEPSTAATAALFAVTIATEKNGGQRPDLLISGINDGENIGLSTLSSGTVGATLTVSSLLSQIRVPAIAISTQVVFCQGDTECELRQFSTVANWLTNNFLPTLPPSILPRGIALNINHPFGAPTGVKLNRQGKFSSTDGAVFKLNFLCPECNIMEVGATTTGFPDQVLVSPPDSPWGDVTNFLNGYITIVPVSSDLTASRDTIEDLSDLVDDLNK